MTERTLDWNMPKHSVEDRETEKADEKHRDHEVDAPKERVDDESDEKVTRRQE